MNDALPIEDLSKTYLEHSMVINNFVINGVRMMIR